MATAAAGTTVGLTGCIGGGGDDLELNVAVWAGTYADRFEEVVAGGYEEETGTTVNVTPAGGEILSELQAAPDDNPPYDVVSADELYYHLGVNDGLYNELREENVPNLENVYPFLKDKPGQGTEYGVPTDGELLAIAYDESDVSSTDWEKLQDTDEYIGFEGVFYIYPMMIGALLAGERDGIGELYHEENHEAVYEEVEQLAENVDIWTGSAAEIFNGIEQGIITQAMWYSGMAFSEADVNDNISVTIPESTGGYVNNYCTVSGTDHREEGERFLNYMLEPEVQTEWAETGFNFMASMEADHPNLTAEAYPSTNEELEAVNFVNFDRLGDLQGYLNDQFQEIRQDN
ncbi:extracellular solute-binding protein [Halalkaliarchaeum sp. AArc-CO]|uniref:ABC transporter substrate-binding protein n=1 Tax=Halalkaliarchaeum sp. AArc-CO TaxID=2866381 RepID=UPI00217ED348|nr:extracellular solute-binding protein [Halalkaliarchaeum sp. AArc-CO]